MSPRKRKTLDICESDLLAEIEAMRPTTSTRMRQFSPEQDAALWVARGPQAGNKVPWHKLTEWWAAKWGIINVDTLRRRLREMEAQGGPKA